MNVKEKVGRLVSVLLSVVMCASMAVPVFAAPDEAVASITVNHVKAGATYEVYKLLDVSVGWDAGDGTYLYSYRVGSEWKPFFQEQSNLFQVSALLDGTSTVTMLDEDAFTTSAMSDFVSAARSYIDKNENVVSSTRAAVWTSAADGSERSHEFTGLSDGYYLVVSNVGTNVMVMTASGFAPAVINEKNTTPVLDKQVDNSMGGIVPWDASDDATSDSRVSNAAIGDRVSYSITVTVPGNGEYDSFVGAENYVVYDKMDDSLSFNNDVSVHLQHADARFDTLDVNSDYYVVVQGATNISSELDGMLADEDYTFCVYFTVDGLSKLRPDDQILIWYSAILNQKAKISDAAHAESNNNTAWMTYGHQSEFRTPSVITRTYTWRIELFKYTFNDGTDTALPGAEFALIGWYWYADFDNGYCIDAHYLVPAGWRDGADVYRLTDACGKLGETDSAVQSFVTPSSGKVIIEGVSAGIYMLYEVEAPAGYNQLDEAVLISVTAANNIQDGVPVYTDEMHNGAVPAGSLGIAGMYADEDEGLPSYDPHEVDTVDMIRVLNVSGPKLPETGGIGTALLTFGGILLIAVAGVSLVLRKYRMYGLH